MVPSGIGNNWNVEAAHHRSLWSDVWLPAREQVGDRESAMCAYLAWEIDLVNQMATDDDHRFKVTKV